MKDKHDSSPSTILHSMKENQRWFAWCVCVVHLCQLVQLKVQASPLRCALHFFQQNRVTFMIREMSSILMNKKSIQYFVYAIKLS